MGALHLAVLLTQTCKMFLTLSTFSKMQFCLDFEHATYPARRRCRCRLQQRQRQVEHPLSRSTVGPDKASGFACGDRPPRPARQRRSSGRRAQDRQLSPASTLPTTRSLERSRHSTLASPPASRTTIPASAESPRRLSQTVPVCRRHGLKFRELPSPRAGRLPAGTVASATQDDRTSHVGNGRHDMMRRSEMFLMRGRRQITHRGGRFQPRIDFWQLGLEEEMTGTQLSIPECALVSPRSCEMRRGATLLQP